MIDAQKTVLYTKNRHDFCFSIRVGVQTISAAVCTLSRFALIRPVASMFRALSITLLISGALACTAVAQSSNHSSLSEDSLSSGGTHASNEGQSTRGGRGSNESSDEVSSTRTVRSPKPQRSPRTSREARSSTEALPLYYAVTKGSYIYSEPNTSRPYAELKFREPVHSMGENGGWMEIRTLDGARGYVPVSAVSNVWIRVSKSNGILYVYRGEELLRKYRADFGTNAFADKVQRGSDWEPDHWRTPDGTFFVVRKNPNSQFYKAFVLNYPTAKDADRGLRQRLISASQHRAIVRAEENFESPPMNTALGGLIEIHGRGTGAGSNWTQGCVAVRDAEMDELWRWVQVGTPVLIE